MVTRDGATTDRATTAIATTDGARASGARASRPLSRALAGLVLGLALLGPDLAAMAQGSARGPALDSQSFRRPPSWSSDATLACAGLPMVVWRLRGDDGAAQTRPLMVSSSGARPLLYRICTVVGDGGAVGVIVDGERQDPLPEDRCLDVVAAKSLILEQRADPGSEADGFYCVLPVD